MTNAPRLNEDLDQKSLLRKYERELYLWGVRDTFDKDRETDT